jgi:outer membrane protein TolC
VSLLNNQLTVAAGLPQSVVIVPDGNFAKAILTTDNIPASTTTLAVQTAEKADKIAEHAEKISRAERLPQIALFAGNYFNSPVLIEIPVLDKNFNYWAVGVSVKYSLSNLYKSGAKIRANQLAVRQANEEKAALDEHISLALDEAFVHYKEAFVLLETKEKSVELATQNYNVIFYTLRKRFGVDYRFA